MTWRSPAQRRADEFDAMIEGTPPSDLAPSDADLLDLVGALRGVPAAEPRPEFVAGLRERLMVEADTVLVPADLSSLKLPERRTGRERRLAAVVGGIALVGASTSIAVASQSALPGDSLYPVKRVIERAHTGLSVGEGNKGTTMLASASDRLTEAEALAREDGLGDELRVAGSLSTFTEQATEASDLMFADYTHTGDESSIAELRDFASSSLDQLATLEPMVPADAHDELIRAADVLATIDAEAARRCPTCGGTPIDSIPPVLASTTESILVPQAPQATVHAHEVKAGGKGAGEKGGQGAKGNAASHTNPELPDVNAGSLAPGSIRQPGSGSQPGGTQAGTSNPLHDLASTLTGGGRGPSGATSPPSVGEVVDGVGGILEGVLDPVTGEFGVPAP
jgi:hypothetical protein